MDIHARRQQTTIQDQENVYAGKRKGSAALPIKRQGLAARGALGDVNTNVQIQRDAGSGKVADAAAEFEKKAILSRSRGNYGHVQSKVDTGRAAKNVLPSSRPPLRREESTGLLATRATIQTRGALKDKNAKSKELPNSLPVKKTLENGNKKIVRFPSIKEESKRKEVQVVKPVMKDPTESLGNLKLAESTETLLIPQDTSSLPEDIEDIDAGDSNSPLLLSVYIRDIYKYLTGLEELYPIKPDHLKNQPVITGKMRGILVDWLVEVQTQFSLILETFQLTVGILDRYLQAVPNVPRDRLQLLGVTAMFIACKYEEVYAPDANDFVCVTAGAYSKADIFSCEREILSKLGFCLARPIPLHFLRRFVKAAHGTSKQHHLGKYFVDLCLVDYSMVHYRPSELAASAICLSIHLLTNKSLSQVWTPTLEFYSEYSLEHITPIIREIAKIVINVENSKYKAVHKKYLDVTLAKVSSLPQLKGDAIYELANNIQSYDKNSDSLLSAL